jgi:Uncharacterized conserved protein
MPKFKWFAVGTVALLFLLTSCGSFFMQQAPAFPRGKVYIHAQSQTLELEVEIASTMEQRKYGLMFRDELPENSGMIFLFPTNVTGGFWMENTKIPLSIAFISSEGEILKIMDMEPYSLKSHDPGVPYSQALEVNQGWFSDHGVKEGDHVELIPCEKVL